jgi:hypothetical protein
MRVYVDYHMLKSVNDNTCKRAITPINDNGHTEWQDWFHVKSWATDSLFNHFTGDNSTTYRRADNVIILEDR